MIRSTSPARSRTCRSAVLGLAGLSLIAMAGCATVPSDPAARLAYESANDPIEPTNRAVFGANQFVDRNVLRPVAQVYRNNVPERAKRSIHSFVANLGEPSVLVNDLLQGNFQRAATTTGRFAINTTLGGAGLFDVATDWHMPHHSADLGQTFGVWGVPTGPSVQLPLFGPSNVRDTIGKVGGIVTNPVSLVSAGAIQVVNGVGSGLGIVDGRATLLPTTDELQRNSLDYYATLRSIAAQRRAALVAEGIRGGPPGKVDDDKTQPTLDVSLRSGVP